MKDGISKLSYSLPEKLQATGPGFADLNPVDQFFIILSISKACRLNNPMATNHFLTKSDNSRRRANFFHKDPLDLVYLAVVDILLPQIRRTNLTLWNWWKPSVTNRTSKFSRK